jgi:hypothetical protein
MKTETKTITTMTSDEFDILAEKAGIITNFVADQEANSGQICRFIVKQAATPEVVACFCNGGKPDFYSPADVLAVLCSLGVLTPGEFHIEVFW